MVVLVVINVIAIIAVLVWLLKIEDRLKYRFKLFYEALDFRVDNIYGRIRHTDRDIVCIKSDLNEIKELISEKEIKEDLEKPKKSKPKKWQLAIIDLDSGMKKVYTYIGQFEVKDNHIAFWDKGDKVQSCHSLVNRQYDIIECN